jgi:hypothetical protein
MAHITKPEIQSIPNILLLEESLLHCKITLTDMLKVRGITMKAYLSKRAMFPHTSSGIMKIL